MNQMDDMDSDEMIGDAPQGMTEHELLGIIRDEMANAVAFIETTEDQRRARLLNRYLGAAYGNEVEGYSSVISRDVFEVVEWALPQLVETFLAGDTVARFDPVGPEDELEAQQQTDLANHVFLKENDGFMVLTTAIKDCLIQEIGVVHWYWEHSFKVEHEYYEGQTSEQIALIVSQGENVEITAAAPSQYGPGLWDVEVARRFDAGHLCIEAIPQEEFIYSTDARSIKDARMVGRRRRITASEMIEYGYDPEIVESLSGDNAAANTSGELARISRDSSDSANSPRNNRRDSEREIDLAELWIMVDFDGDGISELRKVVVAGSRGSPSQILYHEPAPRKPFAVGSPIFMPHRLNGISLAEVVEDLAQIRTSILRSYLDGLYIAQRPRHIVLGSPEDGPMVDMDALMSVVPGGVVTEYAANALRPMVTIDTTAQSIAGLELMKGMREERTGITRTWQGVEAPNALNDTAHGMQMLSNAAGKRLAFIARILAETMVKTLFTGIAAELKQHQRVAKAIRLRGQWVNVDPTSWRNQYDATVEVGLGYGDREQAVFGAQQIGMLQEKLAAFPETASMVGREEVWETVREICKNLGFKNAERFFKDPQTLPPAEPPGPSLEQVKLEQERILKQQELEVKELDIRLTHEREMAKLGMLVVAPQPDRVGSSEPAPNGGPVGPGMGGLQ